MSSEAAPFGNLVPDRLRRVTRGEGGSPTSENAVGQSKAEAWEAVGQRHCRPSLNELDRQVLMFERQWWCYEGSKEQAINDLFQMDATRYYQVLSRLIDTDEALAFDPQLVKRLRRQRQVRRDQRSARRFEAAETRPG